MSGGRIISGTNSDAVLNGSDRSETINGRKGDDQIDGGGGNDLLRGGNGDDTVRGGSGRDLLIGGRGDDKLDGGSGNDKLVGGKGDDELIFVAADNDYNYDIYDGGRDNDTLRLVLTADEANDPGIQNGTIRASKPFKFTSLGLTVKNIEELVIDPVAVDDTASTDEDTAVTLDLLANDTNPDNDGLTITGLPATSTLGATLTQNGDGTFSYDPAGQFDQPAVGETATDMFTYTVTDGAGGGRRFSHRRRTKRQCRFVRTRCRCRQRR